MRRSSLAIVSLATLLGLTLLSRVPLDAADPPRAAEQLTVKSVTQPEEAASDTSSLVPQQLRDPAYERYVDISLLGQAWASLDPVLFTDVLAKLSDGERNLSRPHAGLDHKPLFRLAVALAVEKGSQQSLERLSGLAKGRGDKELEAFIGTATRLGASSRAAMPTLRQPVQELTPESVLDLERYYHSIQQARLIGDIQSLDSLEKCLTEEPDLSPQQITVLKETILASRGMTAQPPKEMTVALKLLFADSRSSGENETTPATDPEMVAGAFLTQNLPALNRNVVNVCGNWKGRKVGDGQCATLALRALRQVGAKQYPPYGPDADYVWGRLVATITPRMRFPVPILPGDILQYRDARFYQRVVYSNGSSRSWSSVARHHTSVVMGVSRTGQSLIVYEQNSGPASMPPEQRMTTKERVVNLDCLQQGWVKVYRPTNTPTAPVIKPPRIPSPFG